MKLLAYTVIAVIIWFTQSACAAKPQMVKPNKHYFSKALIEGVKHFENQPLAVGDKQADKIRYDKYGKVSEIGYGFTSNCIFDAIEEGYLPKGYKLPKRMTKKQADDFLINIVLPTYQKIVKDTVKVELTNKQREALIMFTYNLGRGALAKLVEGDDRLNGGNYKRTPIIMKQYVKAGGKTLKGLKRRRDFEVNELWHG